VVAPLNHTHGFLSLAANSIESAKKTSQPTMSKAAYATEGHSIHAIFRPRSKLAATARWSQPSGMGLRRLSVDSRSPLSRGEVSWE
jgi:hypothetical protein